jgi:hypothetical protein
MPLGGVEMLAHEILLPSIENDDEALSADKATKRHEVRERRRTLIVNRSACIGVDDHRHDLRGTRRGDLVRGCARIQLPRPFNLRP